MTQDVGSNDRSGEGAPPPSGDRPWWGEPWNADQSGGPAPLDSSPRPSQPTQPIQPTTPLPDGGYGGPQAGPYGGPYGSSFGGPFGPNGTPAGPAAPTQGLGHLRTSVILLVAVVALLAAGIGSAVGVTVGQHERSSAGSGKSGSSTDAPAISPSVNAAAGADQTALEAVAATVSPAVVLVTETFGQEVGTGSGVVIDSSKGFILTNNHVVSGFATSGGTLTVTTMAGKVVNATVVGRDPSADIAVIHVSLGGLTQARLGDSAAVRVGETVVAFGAPLGLQGTVTSGIVSALNRPVSTQDTTSQNSAGTQATIDAIQTDAAINPGNSGGALVDLSGKVIGINSAIASVAGSSGGTTESGNIGVGFAIPVNEAKYTADQIIATGHAVHAIIGVALQADSAGSTTNGAVVSSVAAGGPAAHAGIEPGDVIVAIDGKAIPNADAAIVGVRANHKPGDVVQVTISRNGSLKTVAVTLGASPPS